MSEELRCAKCGQSVDEVIITGDWNNPRDLCVKCCAAHDAAEDWARNISRASRLHKVRRADVQETP